MDLAYDMNKTFSPEQSKSQIWTLLVSVGLQKYMEKLMKAGVDFHAFCNLTREDMRHVGITNFKDQDILIELVRPMATMYRELKSYPVNFSQIRTNLIQSSEMLTASLAQMRKAMRKCPAIRCQSLVDSDTPSTQAILALLDLMQSRISLIDRDMKEARRKLEGGVPESGRGLQTKMLVSGTLLVLAAAAVYYLRK